MQIGILAAAGYPAETFDAFANEPALSRAVTVVIAETPVGPDAAREDARSDTVSFVEASAADFAGLYLPDRPDQVEALRRSQEAMAFLREFLLTGRPVAAMGDARALITEALGGEYAVVTIPTPAGPPTDPVSEVVVLHDHQLSARADEDPRGPVHTLARMLWVDCTLDQTLADSFPASDPPGTGGQTAR